MAHEILTNEIGLILPTYLKDKRHRRGILASVLGGIASGVIGLAYEGISSFLHHKGNKALHKVLKVMEKKTDLQHNKIHPLEDTMIMYGIYNSDTLTELIEYVHRIPLPGEKEHLQEKSISGLNCIYIKTVYITIQ